MITNLRKFRFLREKIKYRLSIETEVPQSRISLIENKLTTANPEERAILAEALKTKPEELFPEE